MIRPSPSLEKFVLKLESWWNDMVRGDRKLKKAASFPLQHLKVVQLLGYYGRRSEPQLVEYFLENAIVLMIRVNSIRPKRARKRSGKRSRKS